MKILFHGLNYEPEMIGIAVYTSGLAEDLARLGHQVSVVAAKPYYPAWRIRADHLGNPWQRTIKNGVDVTRTTLYVPQNPTALRRILHHVSFALSSAMPLLWRAWRSRPDVIVAIAPSLIASVVTRVVAKLVGARAWLHVQDFEVEAAVATGLIDSEAAGMRLMRWFERTMLRSFDRVSSISPAMCRKCIEKGVSADRVIEFRNWAQIEAIKPLDRPSLYRMEWDITTPYVALYSGNIANKQGIEIISEVARRLRHRRDLTFVICGNGPNRANLEASAVDLDNIRFHDLQPTERLSELLGLASVHLLVQRASAADLVLPSKLANMLASGRPVVATADPGTGLAGEVEGCGLVIPPENVEALASAIEGLLRDEALRDRLGIAARLRAVERWERSSLVDGMLAELLSLSSGAARGADLLISTSPTR